VLSKIVSNLSSDLSPVPIISAYYRRGDKLVGKATVRLCQGRKTALRKLVTFDTAHCSDMNTVCFKDLTFLFITQHKLEWRAVKDCYGNHFHWYSHFCKNRCILKLRFIQEYWTYVISKILFKLKNFDQVMSKYRIQGCPVFWSHRPSTRYCCNGNCASGSKPI